jgi:hypothetical protein
MIIMVIIIIYTYIYVYIHHDLPIVSHEIPAVFLGEVTQRSPPSQQRNAWVAEEPLLSSTKTGSSRDRDLDHPREQGKLVKFGDFNGFSP